MSQRPWRDRKNPRYGSDANALRRLAEDMQAEDGYNDQVKRLMFRCADALDAKETAQSAEKWAPTGPVGHCAKCGGLVFRRPGKPGEVDHVCAQIEAKPAGEVCRWPQEPGFAEWRDCSGRHHNERDITKFCPGCGRRVEVSE